METATAPQMVRTYSTGPKYTEEGFRPLSTLLTIDLPYQPPSSPLGVCLWKWRLWFEVTLGASVLEPWEKLVFCTCSRLLVSSVD